LKGIGFLLEIMNMTLLTLNKPNLNGRTYTTEVVQKAIDDCQWRVDQRRMLLERGYDLSFDVNVENACGIITKLEIDGDFLEGDVEYFSDFEKFVGIPIRPKAMGTIDEHGIIHDLQFISFYHTDDPA